MIPHGPSAPKSWVSSGCSALADVSSMQPKGAHLQNPAYFSAAVSSLTPFHNRTGPPTAGAHSPAAKQLFPDHDVPGAEFDTLIGQQQQQQQQRPGSVSAFSGQERASAGYIYEQTQPQQQEEPRNASAYSGQAQANGSQPYVQQQEQQHAQVEIPYWGLPQAAAEGGEALPSAPQQPWDHAVYNPTFTEGAP